MDSRKKEIIVLTTFTAVALAAIGIGINHNQSRKSEPHKAVEKAVERFTPTSEVGSILISHSKTAFEEPVSDEPNEINVGLADSFQPEYNGEGNVGWTFSEAFADARLQMGPGRTFIWNSRPFTTFYAEELSILAGDQLAASDSLQPGEKADTTALEEE
jgi:hypothetical protein